MSFAIFRQAGGEDLKKLAEEHLQHDLNQEDRDTLKSATTKLSSYTTIGSLIGLGLTTALALRVRQNRVRMFEVFKASRRPTHVKFADGVEEALPDITPFVKPSRAGDIATYGFFGIAGLFLGGDLGLLLGQSAARKTIVQNPETKTRIERAFRLFKADILRKELQELEDGRGGLGW
ncbi:hypothetical protein D0Z07_0777 [Hyphodiscus hymeniophilus]|uniref:Uncharacterized protein n=1 Tax=Hyphodiscus hymeniophilus TaxID=353542 RepID=A0A9P6VR92_9HELO|nr:hypothetical protein D0Z07_0777 [Hyphodiscus hymeniophilus]